MYKYVIFYINTKKSPLKIKNLKHALIKHINFNKIIKFIILVIVLTRILDSVTSI